MRRVCWYDVYDVYVVDVVCDVYDVYYVYDVYDAYAVNDVYDVHDVYDVFGDDDDNGWSESVARRDFFTQQHYIDPMLQRVNEAAPPAVPSVAIDHLLAQQIDSFVYHLQLLHQSSMDVPQEWIDQGIDPYVAMMLAKSHDPAYAK